MTASDNSNSIEAAGGEPAIRAVLEDFYARVFDDTLIGYLFRGQDRARLVQKELELALGMLGANVPYTGKPIRAAHAKHRILSGHFNRRQQILRETLHDHGVPASVRELWIAEAESLRDQVMRPAGGGGAHR